VVTAIYNVCCCVVKPAGAYLGCLVAGGLVGGLAPASFDTRENILSIKIEKRLKFITSCRFRDTMNTIREGQAN